MALRWSCGRDYDIYDSVPCPRNNSKKQILFLYDTKQSTTQNAFRAKAVVVLLRGARSQRSVRVHSVAGRAEISGRILWMDGGDANAARNVADEAASAAAIKVWLDASDINYLLHFRSVFDHV